MPNGELTSKKSKFTDEQIAYGLRQVEGGSPIADVCRQLGVSEGETSDSPFCGNRENSKREYAVQ